MFPSRDDMVSYFEDYARRNHVDVRNDVRVERIDRDGSELVVRTTDGDERATNVIVATGYAHTPHIPDWPGRRGLRRPARSLRGVPQRRRPQGRRRDRGRLGLLGHGDRLRRRRQRREARPRRGEDVAEHPHPRSHGPALLARIFPRFPTRFSDSVLRKVQLKKLGDLSKCGLPIPDEGVFSRLERLGVAPAIVDKEVIDTIKDGRIEIVAGIRSFDETGVDLDDDTRAEPDVLIAATGYRSALEPMVGHLGVLNERGLPIVADGHAVAPGLRFVGFIPRPAQLGLVGTEAQRAARDRPHELSGSPSRGAGARAGRGRRQPDPGHLTSSTLEAAPFGCDRTKEPHVKQLAKLETIVPGLHATSRSRCHSHRRSRSVRSCSSARGATS